jgi:hypothetical protein
MAPKKVPAKKVGDLASSRAAARVASQKAQGLRGFVAPAPKTAPKSQDKPGPWDNIGRGLKTAGRGINLAGKVVYEVSGAGDVERFARNPSKKNAAMLGITVGAYLAGPAAKVAQTGKAIKAARGVNAGLDARAAANATKAATTSRVVKATKGAGTVTTKSGKALPMTGINTFSTAKNPARSAASTYSMGSRQAAAAAQAARLKAQKNVIAGFGLGGSVVVAKGSTTVSVENQKNKKKKK